jgi:acetaldehyde dehydrogenase/alcohol dehydrogenase
MATVAAEPTQTVPSEVDVLVTRALNALDAFADFDQERVDYCVKKASVAALSQHVQLAQLAAE